MSASIQSATAGGMVSFLAYLKGKGLMNPTTADAYRSAAVKVFEIEGDAWQALDLKGLDVDEFLLRFETLSGSNYTPGSLATYKGRFAKALSMYLDYLESPSSFKAPLANRQSKPLSAGGGRRAKPSASSSVDANMPASTVAAELIEYPFPLSTGATAYLRLPRDIPAMDVERLAAFVKSVAISPTTRSED